jgi:hypothetical protein
MGAYQKGGEKSIQFFQTRFNGPSDGPVRGVDDYAHLLHIIFKKPPASDAIVVSCFSFVARACKRL